MNKIKSLAGIAAIVAVMLSGCAKDGATGPAGPAGAAGVTGPTGPTGNANVKDTVYTVTTWSSTTNYTYCNLTDPQITAAIENSGTVEVFFTLNTSVDWWVVPFNTTQPTPGYTMEYLTETGKVQLVWVGGGTPNSVLGISTCYIKVVAIAPGAMKQHPGTNWSNYSEVQAILLSQHINN